jgi:uncharacterized integral membrane protein
MRLFKLLITLIILCLIAVFVYQNMSTWRQPLSFKFNLYFNEKHDSADIPTYLVILISALVGFIAGLTALLPPHFRIRRRLKRERIEKKQALELLASTTADSQPVGQTTEPSPQTDQATDIKKN